MAHKWFTSTVSLLIILVCIVRNADSLPDVCFSYLGCFSMSVPWYSITRPLPQPASPSEVDTQFFLHTRINPGGFPISKLPRVSLNGLNFDRRRPTFFLTHGFLAHADIDWLDAMKDALLARMDANVFIVDWLKGASFMNYFEVAANTRIVGAEVARILSYLVKYKNATTSKIHLIGHSLGAHVMSYAAKRVPNIARLTGLDPAQPGFEGYVKDVRLDIQDATFVEVIHTNGKPFIPFLGAGIVSAVGHVDFYINGGWDQPGCLVPKVIPKLTSPFDLAKMTLEAFADIVKCPHERSIYVLISSIKNSNCVFWGNKLNPLNAAASVLSGGLLPSLLAMNSCSKDTCSPLGLDTINYPARGSFILSTYASDPYCISEPFTDEKMAEFRVQRNIL